MLRYISIVNRGLVHETNDDTALIGHNIISNGKIEGICEENNEIFAIADGVGGLKCSELASREVLRTISECKPQDKDDLLCKIQNANGNILKIRDKKKLFPNISSTSCIATILDEKLVTYNLGNSRSYRFRDGILLQMTKDQTKVQKLYDAGIISQSEIKTHGEKNIITGYIGCDEFSLDWIDIVEHREKYREGDILVLCSDGLSDYIEIEDMERILSLNDSLGKKADLILNKVYENGAGDNISFVLIEKGI